MLSFFSSSHVIPLLVITFSYFFNSKNRFFIHLSLPFSLFRLSNNLHIIRKGILSRMYYLFLRTDAHIFLKLY